MLINPQAGKPGSGTTRVCLVPSNAQKKLQQHGEARMQAAMAKRKRHSRVEIAAKLAQANDLATQGKLQSEIARTVGVSVMTLHRWRKAPPEPQSAFVATQETGLSDRTPAGGNRIAELQLENARLRRLVTDLLLEKIKVEEAAQSQSSWGFSFDAPLRTRPDSR
jgi:putative transposase